MARDLDKLGVVLAPNADEVGKIVKGAMAHYEDAREWFVYTEGSRKFFSRLFLLLYLTMSRLPERSTARRSVSCSPEVLLARGTDADVGHVARYFRELRNSLGGNSLRGGADGEFIRSIVGEFPMKG